MVFFLLAVAHEADSVLEVVGVAAGMLIFYAPATLWSGGLWSVAVILVLGLLAAMLTHRYRVTGASPRWRRTGSGGDRALAGLHGLDAHHRDDFPVLRRLRRCGVIVSLVLQPDSNGIDRRLGFVLVSAIARGRAMARRRRPKCSPATPVAIHDHELSAS